MMEKTEDLVFNLALVGEREKKFIKKACSRSANEQAFDCIRVDGYKIYGTDGIRMHIIEFPYKLTDSKHLINKNFNPVNRQGALLDMDVHTLESTYKKEVCIWRDTRSFNEQDIASLSSYLIYLVTKRHNCSYTVDSQYIKDALSVIKIHEKYNVCIWTSDNGSNSDPVVIEIQEVSYRYTKPKANAIISLLKIDQFKQEER